MRHDLIKTGDADSFAHIEDRNGEVVLKCCRVCGQGEGTLAPTCPGPRMTTLTPPADAPDLLALRDAAHDTRPLPWRYDEADRIVWSAIAHRCVTTPSPSYGGDDDVMRYLVACANAAPGLVAERDALTVERDLARDEQTYWNRIAQENRAQYLTVADAIAPSSNNAHELADKVRAFRKRAEALESERDTALARVAELEAQNSRLRSTLEGIAERDCEYYDNCPSNARHYVCDVCRATRTLDKETP